MSCSFSAKAGSFIGQFELPPPVGGEPMVAPDLLNRGHRDDDNLGHGHPVRRLVRRRLHRQDHDLIDHRPIQRWNPRWAGLVAQEAIDSCLHEALLPTPDRGLRFIGRLHDGDRAVAVHRHHNDPSPPDMLLGLFWVPDGRFKPPTVRARVTNGDVAAHGADSHTTAQSKIPKWTPLSRPIH